jgi:hypothetical protein
MESQNINNGLSSGPVIHDVPQRRHRLGGGALSGKQPMAGLSDGLAIEQAATLMPDPVHS